MKRLIATALPLALLACGQPTNSTDPCTGRKAGDLVITEAMIDPAGTDTGNEWFELFNALGTPMSLQGLTLFVRDGSGSTKTHQIRAGTIPARSYFTVGDVRSGPNPAWINYTYGSDLGSLPNTTGTIGVRCGTALTLDQVTYTKAPVSGRSRMLSGATNGVPVDPDATLNDDESRWCDTPSGMVFGGGNAGTPGQANPECQPEASTGTCVDANSGAVRAIASPRQGELVITEVLANPSVREATQEWFEVLALASVDLNDLDVSTPTGHDTLTASQCMHLEPGQYGLVARSADPFVNGELPPPLALTTLSLANSNERLTISKGDAGIDMASFTASASGVAWQLDPDKLDAVSNDDPSAFCHAPNPWAPDGGGDRGSPGQPNPPCPPPDAGVDAGNPNECFDVGLQATRAVVRPVAGDLTITEVMADPTAVADTAGEYFEVLVNNPVDLNGLTIGTEATSTTVLQGGDCVAMPAGSYALFARSADPATNGGLPKVTATFGFGLTNSAGHAVVVSSQGVELDRLAYPAATAGASTQLNAGLTAPTDNDVAANLCPTPVGTTYGGNPDAGVTGDRGTPGAANVACP